MDIEYLYRKERYIETWGKDWVGPEVLPHGETVLIARIPKLPSGRAVEVFAEAWPATFYTVKAGNIEITTGSGQDELAKDIALALAQGMLVVKLVDGGK